MTESELPKGPSCGFCGKGEIEARTLLIQGPVTGVCDECVELMVDIIRETCADFCIPQFGGNGGR